MKKFIVGFAITAIVLLGTAASAAPTKKSVKKEPNSQIKLQEISKPIPTNPLLTADENNLSLNISQYAYNEPSLGVTFQGYKGGIDFYRTQKLSNDYFALGKINYFNGPVNYTGSTSASNIPEYYIDGQLGVGRDFEYSNAVFSPFIGIGYRYLYETFSKVTSGYDRQSQYIYIPVGFINRISINGGAKIETTVEYDQLLAGYQMSKLSQVSSTYSDLNNNQKSGYGISASVIYKKDNWGVGPYYKYWNISQSDRQIIYVSGVESGYYGYEPANVTSEYGIKLTYAF